MDVIVALHRSVPGVTGVADNGDGSYRLDFVGSSRLATAQEISDAQAGILTLTHADLVDLLDGEAPDHAKLLRALVLIMLDEFNLHAAKINAILTAIDNGGTLAQVKTNIAAIADYPTRTKANLITAMTNKINAGDADS